MNESDSHTMNDVQARTVLVNQAGVKCTLLLADSRQCLSEFKGQTDLIVTSPPYADARHKHYDSVHPDGFSNWFMTFHPAFFAAMKPTGSLIINIKDKVVDGVRHRFVWHTIEALCKQGWQSIDDYIWHKTNPMPGRWPSRLRDGWEYCFHLSPTRRPFFHPEGVQKPVGDWVESRLRNLGEGDLSRHNSVNNSGFGRDISKWVGREMVLPSNIISLAVVGKNKRHPAVFPVGLPDFFIRLLCPQDGLVIDPFGGSGTTGIAALRAGRNSVLIENNPAYYEEAVRRIAVEADARMENDALYNSPLL